MQFRGIRALAADSGADMTIGVMCTLGGTQATEMAAQLGLLLMCRLTSEEYRPTDCNKSPEDMGPSDISPLVKLFSGLMTARPGVFDQ